MAPKKTEPDAFDLSARLEFQVLQVLQDGKRRNRSVYVVQVRNEARLATCVLKAFSDTKANQEFYKRESAANIALCGPGRPETEEEWLARLFATVAHPHSRPWPVLLGAINTPDDILSAWTRAGGPRKGLLFEYIPDLAPLTNDMLDDEVTAHIMQALRDMQALGVVHWDHVDNSKWPEVGFGNIFVRGGKKDVVILDFNRAKVVGDSARDRELKETELARMQDLTRRAMQGRLAIDEIPKELRTLL